MVERSRGSATLPSFPRGIFAMIAPTVGSKAPPVAAHTRALSTSTDIVSGATTATCPGRSARIMATSLVSLKRLSRDSMASMRSNATAAAEPHRVSSSSAPKDTRNSVSIARCV